MFTTTATQLIGLLQGGSCSLRNILALTDTFVILWPQIVDELVRALMGRYPRAVLQFEDFNLAHALPLLERYRDHHLVFNDDVQARLFPVHPARRSGATAHPPDHQ